MQLIATDAATDAVVKDDSRTQRESVRAFFYLGLFFFVLVAAAYVYSAKWSAPLPRDGTTLVVGRDFLNFWMYGRAAASPDPGMFYDAAIYNRELSAWLGAGYPGQNWSYPPSIMILAAPFGLLNYLPALLCWTLLSVLVFVLVARRYLSDPRLLLALVISPAAVLCVISGQNALITTAMMIGVFAWLDRRPILAGVLMGLLTLKPQIGLLFPVMLIASSRWRVFFAASITAVGLVALTATLFGPQVWIDFWMKGLPIQSAVLSDPDRIATPFYPTIFMNLRGMDLSHQIAMAIQACFSVFAVAAVFWAFKFRKDSDPDILMALLFACSVSVTPYLLSYDTLPLVFAVFMLLATGKLDTTGHRLAQFVYWLPMLQIGLGTWHIPGPALIAPAVALYLVMRLRHSAAPTMQPLAGPARLDPAAIR